MTNILRDLEEDAQRGRVYLPPGTWTASATRPTTCVAACATSGFAG